MTLMESYLSYSFIIGGLVFDFIGVIVLTVLTDSALDSLLDKMNRVVDESWEDSVKKWKMANNLYWITNSGNKCNKYITNFFFKSFDMG